MPSRTLAEAAGTDAMPAIQAETLLSVELPLRDLEYAIESYLLDHGPRLDTRTRCFLAGIRDGVGRVARSVRDLPVCP